MGCRTRRAGSALGACCGCGRVARRSWGRCGSPLHVPCVLAHAMRCISFEDVCVSSLGQTARCTVGCATMRLCACVLLLLRLDVLRLGVRLRLGSGLPTGGLPLRVSFAFGVGCIGDGSQLVLRARRVPPGLGLRMGPLLGSVLPGTGAVGGGLL